MRILKLTRIVAVVLLLCGGVGVLYYGFLWDHYYDVLPHTPEPEAGRTYVMNLRGRTVYATQKEQRGLHLVNTVSLIFAVFGVIGYILTSEDYRQKMGWHYPEKSQTPSQPGPSPPRSKNERDESE